MQLDDVSSAKGHGDVGIARCRAALDRADRERSDVPEARTQCTGEKIAALRRRMAVLNERQEQLEIADDRQVPPTDSNAHSMATSGRGTGIVGPDVQMAVDPEHHLVVAHDVVNEGHGRTQLVPMGDRATLASDAGEVAALLEHAHLPGGPEARVDRFAPAVTTVPPNSSTGSRTKHRNGSADTPSPPTAALGHAV